MVFKEQAPPQSGEDPLLRWFWSFHRREWNRGSLDRRFDRQVRKVRIETLFNSAEPFYSCMLIYLAAFFFAALSWLKWP